jgi:hypothetical protein
MPPIKIGGKDYKLSEEQIGSMIAWKQGIMYKAIYPPYGKKDIINSRKPIEGVKYYEGAGSAQRSALSKGLPPEVVKRKMGIVTIEFNTGKDRTKLDPKPNMDYDLIFTPEQKQSMIAWKQGVMYKAIYSPYGKNDIVNSRTPIEGVKYHDGIGSAVESAIAKGMPPEVIQRDMGIMDISIYTKQSKKPVPVMLFTTDVKQRTQITGVRKSGHGVTKRMRDESKSLLSQMK